MLETYLVRPQTIDRIRALWIGPEIERYVAWLPGYGTRSVLRRVPLLAAFGEFARPRGARSVADLPGHVDAFVSKRAGESCDGRRDGVLGWQLVKEVRGPVEHMLEFAVPGFQGTGRPHRVLPFAGTVPGFFDYLVAERGLRPASVAAYRHHLSHFEAYLQRIGVAELRELSPVTLTAFVAERSRAGLAKTTVRQGCSVLREFLRYAPGGPHPGGP